jgi:hypothetical protein
MVGAFHNVHRLAAAGVLLALTALRPLPPR